MENCRRNEAPDCAVAEIQAQFQTDFDRNQRVFKARMLAIIRKYDRPFVGNTVVCIQDLTCMTPRGRRPWTFEANIPEDEESEEISEQILSENKDTDVDTRMMAPKVEPFHGQTTALMQHNTNDHKKMSPQNSGLSIMRKNMHVALPVNSTVYGQKKRFMEQDNKESFAEPSGRYSVCRADGSGSSNSEEASYSEPGNTSLGDYHPQMIDNLSILLGFQGKTQVADNIIRRYKSFNLRKKILEMKMVNRNMSKSFNRMYTICPAPNSEKNVTASKTYGSTQWQEPHLSLFSELQRYNSPAAAISPHIDSQNNARKPFQCILDSQTIFKECPFQTQKQKEMNGAMSLGYSSRTSSPSWKMCFSPSKSITSKSHMDIAIAQSPYYKDSKYLQQNHSLSRRNYMAGIPMLSSPKQVISKPYCNMSEGSKSPLKSMTTDIQREVYSASSKDHIKQPLERTSTLTRRNFFSAFSAGHNKNKDFERLYENLTKGGPQPVNSAQIELSKTASLGNSPGSLRTKRLLSHESSVSMSKKPRSINNSLNSPFSVNGSDPLGSELTSSRTQQHSAAASPLPSYMLLNNPGSHRSFSPRVNGGRTFLKEQMQVYPVKKLIYQED